MKRVLSTVLDLDMVWTGIPLQVLQRRFITRGDNTVKQGLIRWSDMPDDLATWEDLESLQQRFPRAPAWRQAGSQGRGNVTAPTSATRPVTQEAREMPRRRTRPNSKVIGPEWTQ
ncbi:hypothetical protein BS78_10G255400 [Paspalum vaginatum]|nr:hypothetical protein BS78_10G255400 [Paspalum vaginatum]